MTRPMTRPDDAADDAADDDDDDESNGPDWQQLKEWLIAPQAAKRCGS